MPGVPFNLILRLNDTEANGRPLYNPQAEAAWDEAQTKRKQAARSGSALRPKHNLAAAIMAGNAHYIRVKRAEGANMAEVIQWLGAKRMDAGLKRAGRSEMYKELRASGLWD